MKNLFITILLLGNCLFSIAQENCLIKGRITDQDGKAIPYCSIYIPSIAEGSMANIDGEYSFSVPCNEYEIIFQSLGYERKSFKKVLNASNEMDVSLNTISYQLSEVTVDPSSEDPAYNYIRKATAMAEYYKKQITAYNCKLYVRSFYDVSDIPWVAKKLIPEEDLKDFQTGDINETILEYSYERPNKVREKIIAAKSGSNDTSKTGSDYINLNFYNLGGAGIVNPLSRNAFQVYKFEHIHTYFEGSQAVHKIKIIPRRKGSDLMKGHIYINDKLWNINNVDVEFDQPLAKIKYQQIYNEVEDNVWMPTNHKLKVRVKAVGLKMDINYLATLSDLSVSTDPLVNQQIINNLNLAPPAEQEVENVPKELSPTSTKTESKIEEILQKDKLSKSESLKLVRLIKKQERELEKEIDTSKSFEIKRNRKVEYADSAFATNDSLWKNEREIPLSDQEKDIYVARNSLEKEEKGDTIINKEARGPFAKILKFRGTVKSENKNIRFRPKGLLIGWNGGFNTVDGFFAKKELLSYEWNNRKGKFYKITPWVGYAFARETFLGGFEFNSIYHKEKRAGFLLSAGRNSIDFNRDEPQDPLIHSAATLLFKENYKKFYQADYVNLAHQFDISNGLQLITGVDYEERMELRNNTQVSWSNRSESYTSNIPDNIYTLGNNSLINNNTAVVLNAKLSYTPEQYFRYRRHEKIMLPSKYPTFELNYRQGIDGVLESNSNFQFLSFAIQQHTRIQLIDRVSYHIEAGKFLNKNSLFFADYQNFNAQPFYLLSNTKTNSFKLLDNYLFNSNDYYAEGHLAIEDNHLLLKYLPLLNNTNLNEELTINYLITEQKAHYTEVGYALKRIFLFIDLGAYVSFIDDEYNNWGIRLSVSNLGNN